MAAVFSFSTYYLIQHKDSLTQVPTVVSLCLVTLVGILSVPVFGLAGFHVVLVARGRTTNEQVCIYWLVLVVRRLIHCYFLLNSSASFSCAGDGQVPRRLQSLLERMWRQLLLRAVWSAVRQVFVMIIINELEALCILAGTFTFFFFSLFWLTPHSLAQPTRYVGRKPHRYTFSSATNNIHNVDVSPDQVKVYLNSGGHAKGNGTGPGVTYNKVSSNLIVVFSTLYLWVGLWHIYGRFFSSFPHFSVRKSVRSCRHLWQSLI